MAKGTEKTGRRKRKQPLTAKERNMASEEISTDKQMTLWEQQFLRRTGIDALIHGADYCRLKRKCRWREWEDQILQEYDSRGQGPHFPMMEACVDYAIHVIKGRWEAFEPFLMSDLDHADFIHSYMNEISRMCLPPWDSLEPHILAKDNPTYVVLYAGQVLGRAWPEAEPKILESATAPTPLLFFESVTLFHTEPERMVLCPTAYCRDALGNRWSALEDKMRAGQCVPRVMNEYAREIIAKRLPDDLHQAMMLKSYECPDDPHVKEYVTEFGR